MHGFAVLHAVAAFGARARHVPLTSDLRDGSR